MVRTSRELADVLVRVGQGDRSAFETLYRATDRKLYGVVAGIVASRALAEDIVQEVYVKIWQRAADFDPGRASPITWMAAIARNRALDEAQRRTLPETAEPTDLDGVMADAEDPLASQERSDDYRAIVRCLGELDPQRRDILLLAYYRGFSREALSRRFGHPVPTIKTWLHRSLTQLKTCLAA